MLPGQTLSLVGFQRHSSCFLCGALARRVAVAIETPLPDFSRRHRSRPVRSRQRAGSRTRGARSHRGVEGRRRSPRRSGRTRGAEQFTLEPVIAVRGVGDVAVEHRFVHALAVGRRPCRRSHRSRERRSALLGIFAPFFSMNPSRYGPRRRNRRLDCRSRCWPRPRPAPRTARPPVGGRVATAAPSGPRTRRRRGGRPVHHGSHRGGRRRESPGSRPALVLQRRVHALGERLAGRDRSPATATSLSASSALRTA